MTHENNELAGQTDTARAELKGLKVSLASSMIWAVCLYLALVTGFLLVMSLGFKWI